MKASAVAIVSAAFAVAALSGCAEQGGFAGGGAFGGAMTAAAPARPQADAGNAALTGAVQGGLIQSLVAAQLAARQAQANAGAPSTSALHAAARDGDVARLNRLLDAGGSVDARLRGTGDQVSEGMTPLMTAAKADQLDCVRLLLARGARVDAQSNLGWMAETYADHFHAGEDVRTMLHNAYMVPWDGDPMFLKSTAYPLKSLYASLGKLKARRGVLKSSRDDRIALR